MPQLPGAVRTGPTQRRSPEVLFAACLPEGQQDRQPAPLACFGQGAGLFPGLGQCAAGAGLAQGPSRLRASAPHDACCVTRPVTRGVTRRVTRSLAAANPCSAEGYRLLIPPCVTRDDHDAKPFAYWTCRSLNRRCVTREHRFDHPAVDSLGPAITGFPTTGFPTARSHSSEAKPWR